MYASNSESGFPTVHADVFQSSCFMIADWSDTLVYCSHIPFQMLKAFCSQSSSVADLLDLISLNILIIQFSNSYLSYLTISHKYLF